jgi:APA family basic amino acid/polyamine antiporter
MTETSQQRPEETLQNGGATAPAHGGSVTFTTATAIAVADMIGIGVFTSLGFQVKDIPSGFALLMLWVIGGTVAMCGALSYAELATAFPRSGGEYNFLSRTYHRAVGFLAGWVSATVGFAAPVAVAAMAFGQYLIGVTPGLAPAWLLAVSVIWGVTLVLLAGVRQSSTFQNISTLLKVGLIFAFIVAGFMFGKPSSMTFAPSSKDIGLILSAPFAISLVYVMYSYSGWNAATYIAGDVQDAQRTLPLSLVVAVLTVMTLYIGLNAVFLYTTPVEKLAGQVDVGLVAGREIFGENGGRLVGALICIGLVSAISSMMWIGPRVTMVMGEDMPLLRAFARRSSGGTPTLALLLQACVATVLVWTGSFESVVQFIQFSLMFCSLLAVIGVLVLRFMQPDLPRPYRVWGYPITPLVFTAVTLFMMVHQLREKPVESLGGLGMMLAGLAVYFSSARAGARNKSAVEAKGK